MGLWGLIDWNDFSSPYCKSLITGDGFPFISQSLAMLLFFFYDIPTPLDSIFDFVSGCCSLLMCYDPSTWPCFALSSAAALSRGCLGSAARSPWGEQEKQTVMCAGMWVSEQLRSSPRVQVYQLSIRKHAAIDNPVEGVYF